MSEQARQGGDPGQGDAALITSAAAGDRQAMAELLRRHGPQVRQRLAGKISSVWRSSVDEDDIMQVTYMEAFLRITSFVPRHEGSFLAWLTLIAENNLRDAIKSLERAKRPSPKKRVQPNSDESYTALVEVLGATFTTPSVQAARGELRSALDVAIDKLPPHYATAIRLHDLAGKEIAEVAAELGKSEGAVFMMLARARERLKELLGSESQFFSRS